jgi:hypothetical protein
MQLGRNNRSFSPDFSATGIEDGGDRGDEGDD